MQLVPRSTLHPSFPTDDRMALTRRFNLKINLNMKPRDLAISDDKSQIRPLKALIILLFPRTPAHQGSHSPYQTKPSSMFKLSQDQGFVASAAIYEIVCLIFYAVHFETAHYKNTKSSGDEPSRLKEVYAMFMDVHVMIFVGFGFLMTYLRKYSLSAVSLNFVVAALSLQWGIVCVTMAHQIGDDEYPKKIIDVPTLINADFAAGAVLISFGAVLGKVTPTQLLWMSFFEVIFYALNEYILVELLEVIDAGGSMVIHTFGAFFGLALTLQIGAPGTSEQEHNRSRYTSDIVAMIGTLFLWMYWPSFNAALVPSDGFRQERAVVNTLLSIAASCAATFAASKIFAPYKKFDMVHLQNATLAGGVAMGATCELAINPASAVTIGIVSGVVSVIGYVFFTPALEEHIGLSDTAGILNLHGIPGVIGGLACGFATMALSDDFYDATLTKIYRARGHRSAGEQGGYQILATVVAVGIGIVSGSLVGRLLRSSLFRQQQMLYEDDEWFHVPLEFPLTTTSPLDLSPKHGDIAGNYTAIQVN